MTVGSFVQSEQHRPLEALLAGNDHPQSATKWIGGNPALVGFSNVLAARPTAASDTLTSSDSNSFAVEDQQRHMDRSSVSKVTLTRCVNLEWIRPTTELTVVD